MDGVIFVICGAVAVVTVIGVTAGVVVEAGAVVAFVEADRLMEDGRSIADAESDMGVV